MTLIELQPILMLGRQPNIKIVEDMWIAGGAIRSWFTKEPTTDIDGFFKNEDALKKFLEANSLSNPVSTNKITDTYKSNNQIIQAIKLYKNTVEELFDGFDFTVCCFAWDGKKIYSTQEAVIATLRKHLAVNKIQKGYETDSLRRAFKYQRKGYTPCLGTVKEIALSFNEVTPEAINQQIQISPGGRQRLNIRWD